MGYSINPYVYERLTHGHLTTGEHVSQSTNSASKATSTETPTMAPASTWTPQGKPSPRKRRRTFRNVMAVALVSAYVAGAWFFSSHFTPGTVVDGVDASMMTTFDLAHAIEEQASTYKQHLTDPNGFDATITSEQIGLKTNGAKAADEALSNTTPSLWLTSMLVPQHMEIDADVTADEEKIASAVEQAVKTYNESAEAPTDANARYNEETGKFEIVQESIGTALDAAKVVEASSAAISKLDENVAIDESALSQPTITTADQTLNDSVERANKILDAGDIEVVCDGETIATIDRATMAPWIHFDEERKLDISGVVDWVNANEAVQSYGNANNDDYRWQLDVQGMTDEIHRVMEQDLGDKAELKREIIEVKPSVDPNAKSMGRHVDITIGDQYVRFYDDSGTVIWESYCVTGGYDVQTGEMHATPIGTFAIQTKELGRTLIGADRNGDGEPDYESYVNFWMPFLDYDFGLHDATWRWDFGGDIRFYDGSHGCVNLPYEAAAELFDIVQVGDPVVVRE